MTKSHWRTPAAMAAAGLAVTAAGFAYDVIYAGIPYQDPTPELAARYRHHQRIAERVELAGLLLIGTGVAMMGVLGAVSVIRRRRASRG